MSTSCLTRHLKPHNVDTMPFKDKKGDISEGKLGYVGIVVRRRKHEIFEPAV